MDEIVDASLARLRFSMFLLAIFGAVALLLAAIGIYGVVAYSVTQRTREIGIRIALGAARPDVLRMLARGALKLAAAGIAVVSRRRAGTPLILRAWERIAPKLSLASLSGEASRRMRKATLASAPERASSFETAGLRRPPQRL